MYRPRNHLSPRSPYTKVYNRSVCHTSEIISIHDHQPPCRNVHMLLSIVEDLAPPSQATCFLQHIMLTSSCIVLVWTASMILQQMLTHLYTLSTPMSELVRWSVQLSCSNHENAHPHAIMSCFSEHPLTSSTRSTIRLHISVNHAPCLQQDVHG